MSQKKFLAVQSKQLTLNSFIRKQPKGTSDMDKEHIPSYIPSSDPRAQDNHDQKKNSRIQIHEEHSARANHLPFAKNNKNKLYSSISTNLKSERKIEQVASVTEPFKRQKIHEEITSDTKKKTSENMLNEKDQIYRSAAVDNERNKNSGEEIKNQLIKVKDQMHSQYNTSKRVKTEQENRKQYVDNLKQPLEDELCSEEITKINNLNESKKNVSSIIRQSWKQNIQARVKSLERQKNLYKVKKELSRPLVNKQYLQPQIPRNKQVQQIFQQTPLRQRYGYLIQKQDRYLIGHSHRLLLSILRDILSTISFICINKAKKSCFLTELKKKVNINNRALLTHKTIEQLQCIDDSFFKVEWQVVGKNRQNQNEYDLMISLPKGQISLDSVVTEARRKIVAYLMAMQLEFRRKNNIVSGSIDKWIDGFDPNNYQIPQKILPMRPDYASYSLASMTTEEINQMKNEPLKEVCLRKKEQYEAQSRVSSEIITKIFNKDENKNIRDTLYTAIYEKQSQIQEEMKRRPSELIDCQTILTIIDSIMMTYAGRRVSFMARSSLIGILEGQGHAKRSFIIEAIRVIVGIKDIGLLTEETTSSNINVLKFHKGKFSAMRKYFQNMNPK